MGANPLCRGKAVGGRYLPMLGRVEKGAVSMRWDNEAGGRCADVSVARSFTTVITKFSWRGWWRRAGCEERFSMRPVRSGKSFRPVALLESGN